MSSLSRRQLSRLLSACESRLPSVRAQGEATARSLLLHPGWRIGITGPPGAGKSSLVQALGLQLLHRHGGRLGVLCVDPSSVLTGGSVLGDRTRMGELGQRDDCFVRGSAAGTDEGGLNSSSRYQLLALQGWADITLVESVGVGQSEHEIEALVDTMILLLAPGAGDALQGMKRGLTELADLVVINKNDGDLAQAAQRAASDYRSSLRLLGTRKSMTWKPPVLRISTKTGYGMDGLIRELERHRDSLGDLNEARAKKEWDQLWLLVSRRIQSELKNREDVRSKLSTWKADVMSGKRTVDEVVEDIVTKRD